MNLKEELIKITNIDKISEDRFPKTPSFPYIVYTREQHARGADNKNNIIENTIAFALYDSVRNKEIEQKIEKWLNGLGVEYDKDINWQDQEKCYEIYYEYDELEKKEE